MASGGKTDTVVTQQPKTPTDVDPDIKKMMDTFIQMGVKPKADSPEELTDWMIGFLKMKGKLDVMPDTKKGKLDVMPDTKIDLQPPPIPSAKSTSTPSKSDDRVTKMMMNHPPKIPWFSGNEVKTGDVPYDIWRHEVKVLLRQTYEKEAMLNAVRRSLRGEAGYVAMRLDLDAPVEEILHKLDSVYGSIEKKEELLGEFYGARQKEDESVSAWSCRLESTLSKAIERGIVQRSEVDGMLHSMLWTGLRTSLKDISGHKYDTVRDFDGLRVALRQIENDHIQRESTSAKSRPQTSKAAAEVNKQTDIEELKGMIHQLVNRMDTYETRQQQPWPRQQQQQPPWQRQQQQPPWQRQQQQQPPPGQQQQWQQQQPQRGRGTGRGQPPPPQPQSNNTSRPPRHTRDVQCWRCKQYGHMKADCRVRLDHYSGDLNGHQPMQREHP